MTSLMKKARLLLAAAGLAGAACALSPARAEEAKAAPVAAAPAAVPITDQDLTSVKGPDTAMIAEKGDAAAEFTGTVTDIAMADPAKGLTLADVLNQVGHNRIAINFTW